MRLLLSGLRRGSTSMADKQKAPEQTPEQKEFDVHPAYSAARPWEPASDSAVRTRFGRTFSWFCYPAIVPHVIFSHCDSTVENARWWRNWFVGSGICLSVAAHGLCIRRWSDKPLSLGSVLAHGLSFLMVDCAYLVLSSSAHLLSEVLGVDRSQNRVMARKLRGPRVLVVGNGPSAVEGEQLGHKIDEFDEVVRFNNFQTKTAGLEKWVGSKTTVHYSDGVLFPSFVQYNVPGADIVLSLIMDRFMVAGSYVIQRGGVDLQVGLTANFLRDPAIGWTLKADIERLKGLLGLTGVKHPTSGMLAIDHFLNSPGVELPVYIHGFDFFQGPKIHYYNEHESWYERVNNVMGVNFHSPLKEKIYVEKLIAEGKVRFLKDMPQ